MFKFLQHLRELARFQPFKDYNLASPFHLTTTTPAFLHGPPKDMALQFFLISLQLIIYVEKHYSIENLEGLTVLCF